MSDLVCTVYRGRCQFWCVLYTEGGVTSDVYCIQGEVSVLVCTVYRGSCQIWYVLYTGGGVRSGMYCI